MTTPNSEHLVGNLIDISSEDNDSPLNDNNTYNASETHSKIDYSAVGEKSESINVESECRGYSRLCGYLKKLGNQPILKTFRKRWFVFSESNCKLYYYRSAQDYEPLGEIDISQATFSFEVDNKERAGLFRISVPGRDYYLEAANQQASLFWLQELQKYRRVNSLKRTQLINDQSASANEFSDPQNRLVASGSIILQGSEETPLMIPVDCPKDVIGDESATAISNPLHTAQQKLNSFYNQVKNTASFSKSERSSVDLSSPIKESISQPEICGSPAKLSFSDHDSATGSKSSRPLSGLRLKLSHSFRKSRLIEDEMPDSVLASKENCQVCQRLQLRVEELEENVSNLQYEVSTSREVQSLLQRQLDIAAKEKDTLIQIYQLKDSDSTLNVLNDRDNKIVNLTHDLQEQQQEVESLQRQILFMKSETKDLQKNNELFQEMLIQKDETIMKLTNEIFELETDRRDEKMKIENISTPSEVEQKTVEQKDSETIEDLKVAVQAFGLQNKFLNNELLELNQLRKDSEERVNLYSMKCSEWEARSYQIQSKLLFLLNELNKNEGKNFSPDIVSQLLEEAVGEGTAHTNLLPSWSREKKYDKLGFDYGYGQENVLSAKATNLKQKSEDITSKSKDPELFSWQAKWDNYFVTLGSKEIIRCPELKFLVRTGIPHDYRGKIWKGCVYIWIKDYKSLLGPDYYNSLLTSEEYVSRLDPSSKQIELDLLRTLPNNCHYESLDADNIPKLRRVLLAYSRHDPVVGYCQGLNRLAAIALLFMDEEDAFWCLVAIIKFIMPDGYYTRTLISSHVDQKVLKDMLLDKIPKIFSHFENQNIDLSLFTFNWFLTIFVDNVPVEVYLRIWDVFLYEGSKVLFRYALAFFKFCENEILQIKDYLALNKYLRSIAEVCTDFKKLTHIAFNELNPFPQKTINSKRAHHFQIIRKQLEDLENEKKRFKKESGENISAVGYFSEED